MKYVLTRAVLGCTDRLDITPKKYEEIRRAKAGVVGAVAVEEKFDSLVGNYRDLEVRLLSLATDDMLYGDSGWSLAMDHRNDLNRMLANLLSSCRMYLDQLEHHLAEMLDDPAQATQAKSWKSNEYDAHFAYRFLEAHRNYVQHRGEGIHRLSYAWVLVNLDGREHREHCVHPVVDMSILRSDGNFKRSVLAEADKGAVVTVDKQTGVDLKPLLREYLQCLYRIHAALRTHITGSITRWEQAIQDAVTEFSRATKSDTVLGLAVAELLPKGVLAGVVPISDELAHRRAKFIKRNAAPMAAGDLFVSGRLRSS